MSHVKRFIAHDLSGFIGSNIDLVGMEMEAIVHANFYEFRWLEPDTPTAPETIANRLRCTIGMKQVGGEFRAKRINVHVNKDHVITSLTVG